MTSLVQDFLNSGAQAYPCGNAVQAKKMLLENPVFENVKVVSARTTKLRSTLSKKTSSSKARSPERV